MKLIHGDCLQVMPMLPECSIDTIITDPPYGLSFMGKEWDHGIPGVPFWEAALRVAKPGAMLLAFGGSRTFHRLTVAIEDAGWEIRDCLMWLYGTGFPKGQHIGKAIDKAAGAKREVIGYDASRARPNRLYEAGAIGNIGGSGKISDRTDNGATLTAPATDLAKDWEGWNTSLKPAWEPIILAMKPLEGTFASNATRHGVAGFNIDGCRIAYQSEADCASATPQGRCTSKDSGAIGATPDAGRNLDRVEYERPEQKGRWPANVILDEEAAAILDEQTGILTSGSGAVKRTSGPGYQANAFGKESRAIGTPNVEYGDSGGASRFFYCAKSPKSEKGKFNDHPTVKPLALMEYLCKLTATPSGGNVLDPFMGSGSTGVACEETGRDFIGIELDEHYYEIAQKRLGGRRAA